MVDGEAGKVIKNLVQSNGSLEGADGLLLKCIRKNTSILDLTGVGSKGVCTVGDH